MSMWPGSGFDENCIDAKALESRDFPLDRLVKVLSFAAQYGIHVTEMALVPEFWTEVKDQLGSKMTDTIHGAFGATKIRERK